MSGYLWAISVEICRGISIGIPIIRRLDRAMAILYHNWNHIHVKTMFVLKRGFAGINNNQVRIRFEHVQHALEGLMGRISYQRSDKLIFALVLYPANLLYGVTWTIVVDIHEIDRSVYISQRQIRKCDNIRNKATGCFM